MNNRKERRKKIPMSLSGNLTTKLSHNIHGKIHFYFLHNQHLHEMLCLAMIFFGFDTKSKSNKNKINKGDYIQLKSFCTAKDSINKMKKQSLEWERIFVNHISHKGLICKIYKKFIQLNSIMENSMAFPQEIKNRTTI